MTDKEKAALQSWVNNWKETGKILEDMRREEIRNSNLAQSITALDTAFRSALWLNPSAPTSGLIEFHKIMARSR